MFIVASMPSVTICNASSYGNERKTMVVQTLDWSCIDNIDQCANISAVQCQSGISLLMVGLNLRRLPGPSAVAADPWLTSSPGEKKDFLFFLFQNFKPFLLPDGESDAEMGKDEDFSKPHGQGGRPAESDPLSYISLTDSSFSLDCSPPSSPEKDPGGEWSCVGRLHLLQVEFHP